MTKDFMKDMNKSLKERITRDFTVNNTKSNKIILFDLDDTIINTTADILITRKGVPYKRISNAEFNNYKLKLGEKFCFDEFEDPYILSQSTFTRYWNTLKREYSKGTHIGILTARGDCNLIRNFFLNNGIDIKDELVMAINDPSLNLESNSIQNKKAEVIGLLANAGYDTIIFFDDNEPNLVAAKSLENIYPIKIHTILV